MVTTEPTDATLQVHTISGLPTFAAADELEREILRAAGLTETSAQDPPRQHSPTTFHIASRPGGPPLGVAATTIGPLAEVPLGLALIRAGVTVTEYQPLPGPVCELVNLAVDHSQDSAGVSELLYRAVYRWAEAARVPSLVVGLDPWILDVMQEQYGVPFQPIGPLLDLLGRELLPVGGELAVLESKIAVSNPAFHTFLTSAP